MSESADAGAGRLDLDPDRLVESLRSLDETLLEFKRALVGGSGDDLLGVATDLWEVLDELEDVLGTIDFAELPEAIDFERLPDAVEFGDLPESLFDEDEAALDLSGVREALDLRELWDAVDLTELYGEKQEFDAALAAFRDGDGGDGDGGEDGVRGLLAGDGLFGDDGEEEADEDDEIFANVVDVGDGANVAFDAETRQAYLEEKILEAVEKFREALLTAHEKLRRLYRANQEKLGDPGRQPRSLNPTAASTMPAGPIPDSASTRASTVPSQVRYSRVETPRRIYGRRFDEETTVGDQSSSAGGADEDSSGESAGTPDGSSADEAGDGTDEIRIEVYDGDD